ncbi:hypothetical protein RclHR1_12700003 [Rhizophagus clarus]|uniref:Tc1-like transposase DDE domain-containing protein n=1 Tax=Rhizophagus clarus TaxID=94130 RepID=A0A2Z6Q9R6_9GLOM|nr:hypothetical protein RclHR1_12700003 [Rhizophagus clarus]
MTFKRKELTAFERGEVIGAWKCGISERKISEALSHPQSTIHDVISVYKSCGHETLPSRPGRNPIMTERDSRHLVRILKQNRKTNLQELHEDFLNSTPTRVCKNTLKKNEQAKERKEWTNEWKSIIWSDESKFELFRGNGRRWIWRQPHEKYDVECLIPTVKSGQQGVMVWGCFANHSLGPLVKLEGSVTAISYIDVLENNLLPFLDDLDDQENYFFQEDNAPIHTARIVKSWKEDNGVNSIPWPAQSPDMNPIKNL